MESSESRRHYWRKNLAVIAVLMLIWFVVTFVVGYYARELSFNFFGWPFSYWVGAQGAPVVYCLIIGFYAWYMHRQDVGHDVDEDEE
ncbi:DUF4212 domain-containing protein [Hydrogenophaga sp. MI9]|uniref:DUF4212 domain-containing protein n=1 Tax=Hydrogenophaga sp. MI9 TaxID=3453719 RepID=UPI003EE934A0